jgi:hypothetical protein
MNIIAKWILESLAAAAVIVICLCLPQALHLPAWTLGLTAIPLLLYLSWRLDGKAFAWRRVLVLALVFGALLIIEEEFLPQSWNSWSRYVIIFTFVLIASRFRRTKELRAAA